MRMEDKQGTGVVNVGPTQESYDFNFRLDGRAFKINGQTTIAELDAAIIAINHSLSKFEKLAELKEGIHQFMRQHHAFDSYIDEFLTKTR
jgi:hypothetical protein